MKRKHDQELRFVVRTSLHCLAMCLLLISIVSRAANLPVLVKVPKDSVRDSSTTYVSFQVIVVTFLGKGKVDLCNGAIIGRRHVLTAASCIVKGEIEGLPNVQVIVQHDDQLKSNYSTFNVVTNSFYQKKGKEYIENDIVILETDRPMFGKTKHGVPLQTQKRYRSKNCVLAGWMRKQKQNNASSGQFSLAPPKELWKLNAVSWRRCFMVEIHIPKMDLLCIGKLGVFRDRCQEDPGAPVMCDGVLTGMVTGSLGCSNQTFSYLYTDVGYYWSWINETLRKHTLHESLSHRRQDEFWREKISNDLPPRRRRRESKGIPKNDFKLDSFLRKISSKEVERNFSVQPSFK